MNEVQKPKLLTVVHIGLLIIGFGIVFLFAQSIYNLWRKGDVIKERQTTLEALQLEQIELKNKLSDALRPEFIEEEARNKLNLVRQDETLVVLPVSDGELVASRSAIETSIQPVSNLQKWWRFFSHGEYGG